MAPTTFGPYAGLPDRIFGRNLKNLTVPMIRGILSSYGRTYRDCERKPALLGKLLTLEGDISAKEAAIVRQSILVGSCVQIRDILNKALGKSEVARKVSKRILEISKPPSATTLECSVCLESLTKEQFPHKAVGSCKHEPTICQTCFVQSIEIQIPDLVGDQLTCPECPEVLPFDVSRNGHPLKHLRGQYDKKMFLNALSNMPNFTMCLGPGCESGQIHGGGVEQPIMTCTTCQFKTCIIHKMPWHAGQTCAEYDAEQKVRTEQEVASENLVAMTAKLCPRPTCGYLITKISGCDHMTCRRCNLISATPAEFHGEMFGNTATRLMKSLADGTRAICEIKAKES